jgi:hypothetical protein
LAQIEIKLPDLKVDFLPPIINHDSFQILIEDLGTATAFIPDGIFSLTCASQRKALLFFLEVDMGIETLSSRNQKNNDVQSKILSYQHIFRTTTVRTLVEWIQLVSCFKHIFFWLKIAKCLFYRYFLE